MICAANGLRQLLFQDFKFEFIRLFVAISDERLVDASLGGCVEAVAFGTNSFFELVQPDYIISRAIYVIGIVQFLNGTSLNETFCYYFS